MADSNGPDDDHPAVTGAPVGGGTAARREAVTGDDAGPADDGSGYPADGASPDRGSSAPRD